MSELACKSDRLLRIYTRLNSGETLNQKELAALYGVTERSIQRDIVTLRRFFVEQGVQQQIVYDRETQGYYMETGVEKRLSGSEALAVGLILLNSRVLQKDEMWSILDKLISYCVCERDAGVVMRCLARAWQEYEPLENDRQLLDRLGELGQAVREHKALQIRYRLQDGRDIDCTLEPTALRMAGNRFYLVALSKGTDGATGKPASYDLDRITAFQVGQAYFAPADNSNCRDADFVTIL